ncbi:sugar kinase [Halalkalibacillus sediminis]|uniref:Sugar kinase n=1 Tax=Halalkalibacillus sediminis TaxID=2018042 RepID=A0A2I0QS11_9BACI|nr:carbohydrate kinase [Halalkalibacillus sediminis]PKR77111.1 sugar kinase [Halalkalibacillus sediminis]
MNKEEQILNYIRINPYISQQQLSEKVGISRPAVANYIKKLVQSGQIKGRAYILNDQETITCIGGANVDRKAIASQTVRLQSSNPVNTEESLGGVARNVAENFAKLSQTTSLITFVGQDKEGEWLLKESKRMNIDISQTAVLPNHRTGTYTALLEPTGELVVSLADMDIYDEVTSKMIEDRWNHISSSQMIFADTNITEESLIYLINNCKKDDCQLYLDPVSSIKAEKLPEDLSGVHTLLPNQEEAEILSGVTIKEVEDCSKACEFLHARGVKQVVITLGSSGIYFSSKENQGHIAPPKVEVVDVTGAGDAFAACLMYGQLKGESLESACRLGLSGAAITLQANDSVSPQMSAENINHMAKEFFQ